MSLMFQGKCQKTKRKPIFFRWGVFLTQRIMTTYQLSVSESGKKESMHIGILSGMAINSALNDLLAAYNSESVFTQAESIR